MDIAVLEAESADAPEILKLQKLAYQTEAALYSDWTIPPLLQTLPQLEAEFSTQVFLKAMDSGKIVGSARGFLEKRTCHIGRVIVHPEWQRKGIGLRLMQCMETVFPRAERFELFTGSRSAGNLQFYQRLGYRAFKEEALSPKVRLVYMEKLGVPTAPEAP